MQTSLKRCGLKFSVSCPRVAMWSVIVAFPSHTNLLFGILKCADPESFVRRGPTLTTFFFNYYFFDEGKENPNTIISRPSSARQ